MRTCRRVRSSTDFAISSGCRRSSTSRCCRLGEVRRRLQTSNAAERSVSEVALDCGFCHLSQFAADYKRVFLESPSATRRAAERPGSTHVARYETGAVAVAAR